MMYMHAYMYIYIHSRRTCVYGVCGGGVRYSIYVFVQMCLLKMCLSVCVGVLKCVCVQER